MQPQKFFVETNGIQMQMIEAGSGPPIVFIHGLGWDHRLWTDAFARYSDSYRVIAGDTRGHGSSTKPAGPYSIDQFANDWRGALDEMDVKEACLVGFSQGGMIAMQLGIGDPGRFSGLILAATVCRITPRHGGGTDRAAELRAGGPERAAHSAKDLIFSQSYIDNYPEQIEAFIAERTLFPMEPLIAAMEAGTGFDFCARLSTYENQCLVVAGERDILTKPEDVREVANALPHCHFELIAEAGHMIPVEQASPFYGAIDQYLADWATNIYSR